MRNFFSGLCIIFCIACSPTPKDKMINEIDTYVKGNIPIPESYKFVSLAINDTITTKDALNLEIDNAKYVIKESKHNIEYNNSIGLDYTSDKNKIAVNNTIIAEKTETLKNLQNNKIEKIYTSLQYQSKNEYGALSTYDATVIFNDSLKLVSFRK